MILVKRVLYRFWPFFLFLLFFVFIFYKVFLNGLFPFPGDLLISWFFPYKIGGWSGFTPWITHKEFIAADAVRQVYPWKTLAIDIIKSGSIPLWNPYAFSGTPLLANLQSAVFYPLNVVFFLFSYPIAWNIFILLQPILAFVFMYLFIRSLKLSSYAAIFAGIAFAFMGYSIVWLEWGVVDNTALWLPLCLFGITMYLEKKQSVFLLFSSFSLACSFFAGHAQTAVYVLLVSLMYYFWMSFANNVKIGKVFFNSWFVLLGCGLSAVQLVPTIELFFYSARNSQSATAVFNRFQLEWRHIVTLLVPDFFGNPGSGNFWGREYTEFIIYVGVVVLVFALVGFYHEWKNKIIRLFFLLGCGALLLALPTFISELILIFKIPVLSTGNPSRSLFVFQFSLVIASAYGVDRVFNRKQLSKAPFLFLTLLYVGIWLFVLCTPIIFPSLPFIQFLSIAKKNMFLPSFMFVSTIFLIFFAIKKSSIKFIALFLILFLMSFEYQYFLYKYSPFAPLSYFFPNQSLISYLQNTTPPDRVYGYDSARFETNLPTQWRLLSPEGYDPLYIRRYGELMYASYGKRENNNIPRSDALLEDTPASLDTDKKQKLMNLLGIKYIIARDDELKDVWNQNISRYPTSRYDLIKQNSVWQVYSNKASLPRAAMFYNVVVKSKDNNILDTFFSKEFPYGSTLILEEDPGYAFQQVSNLATSAAIKKYVPNRVDIAVTSDRDGMLFLSDAFYPGWKAYVDTKETKIFRADYAFRSVFVSAGKHTVSFVYKPISFIIGAIISGISLFIAFGIVFVSRKKLFDVQRKKQLRI